MIRHDTPRNCHAAVAQSVGSARQHRRLQYQRDCDKRKRPIRGLWFRNGRYYAQLTLEDLETGEKHIRLLRYAGSGKSETLRLRWSGGHWEKRQMTIGSDGQTKSGRWRTVDFNAPLEAHLEEMRARRAPENEHAKRQAKKLRLSRTKIAAKATRKDHLGGQP